jgi:hypothetical protein
MVNQDTIKQNAGATQSDNARRHNTDLERQKTDKEIEGLRSHLEDIQMKYEDEKQKLMAEKKAKVFVETEHKAKVQKLEDQVASERAKREKLARSRVQKNETLIGKF